MMPVTRARVLLSPSCSTVGKGGVHVSQQLRVLLAGSLTGGFGKQPKGLIGKAVATLGMTVLYHAPGI